MPQHLPRIKQGPAYVIACASCKGGTGKSMTAEALGSGLALKGYAVLVIEAEYNMTLLHTIAGKRSRPGEQQLDDATTTWLLFTRPEQATGMDPYKIDYPLAVASQIPSLNKPMVDAMLKERKWHPQVMHFIPGTQSLEALDEKYILTSASSFAADFRQEVQLARAVDALRPFYDYIIIDTPPTIGLVQRNALAAADEIVIIGTFATDSVEDILRIDFFIDGIRQGVRRLGRRPPHVLGVLWNQMWNTDRDRRLYKAYTEKHPGEDEDGHPTGDWEEPLVRWSSLGTIPFDHDTLVTANDRRRSIHIWAPTSGIGRALYTFVEAVDKVLTAVPAGR
jgi:cellulose biosynthesis protein BcsQ